MSCQLNSFLIACLITILVVLFIYIFSWNYHRDSAEAVVLRTLGLAAATIISLIILRATGYIDYTSLQPSISLSPSYLIESVIVPIGLTVLLFIGPIIDKYNDGSLFSPEIDDYSETHKLLRTYLIGPIAEEYVYRFLLVTLLSQCFTPMSTVLISSALFSLSHTHHHIKSLITDRSTEDWIFMFLHLTQTFLFACYVCCIYLKVNSVLSTFLIHAFCNWLSTPRFDRILSKTSLTLVTTGGLFGSIVLLTIFVNS